MKITDLQVFVWFNLLFGVEAVFLYVLHIILEFAGLGPRGAGDIWT